MDLSRGRVLNMLYGHVYCSDCAFIVHLLCLGPNWIAFMAWYSVFAAHFSGLGAEAVRAVPFPFMFVLFFC
jgi:hypothetical protein